MNSEIKPFFIKGKNKGFGRSMINKIVNIVIEKRNNSKINLPDLTNLLDEITSILRQGKHNNPDWTFDGEEICNRIKAAESSYDIRLITEQIKKEAKSVPETEFDTNINSINFLLSNNIPEENELC